MRSSVVAHSRSDDVDKVALRKVLLVECCVVTRFKQIFVPTLFHNQRIDAYFISRQNIDIV